jgi:hypothetical protein
MAARMAKAITLIRGRCSAVALFEVFIVEKVWVTLHLRGYTPPQNLHELLCAPVPYDISQCIAHAVFIQVICACALEL